MKIAISKPEDIGRIVRAARKANGMRQDDTAGSIGVSENFLGKVERGSETVLWGKLFQVLDELGLRVSIEVPEVYAEQTQKELEKLDIKLALKSSYNG